MPGYFFATRDNGAELRDDQGFNLPDLNAVKVRATMSLEKSPPMYFRQHPPVLGCRCAGQMGQPVPTTKLTFEVKFLVDSAG